MKKSRKTDNGNLKEKPTLPGVREIIASNLKNISEIVSVLTNQVNKIIQSNEWIFKDLKGKSGLDNFQKHWHIWNRLSENKSLASGLQEKSVPVFPLKKPYSSCCYWELISKVVKLLLPKQTRQMLNIQLCWNEHNTHSRGTEPKTRNTGYIWNRGFLSQSTEISGKKSMITWFGSLGFIWQSMLNNIMFINGRVHIFTLCHHPKSTLKIFQQYFLWHFVDVTQKHLQCFWIF